MSSGGEWSATLSLHSPLELGGVSGESGVELGESGVSSGAVADTGHRIFEFADSENTVIHARNVSISCTELKSVQFCLVFAYIWLPWQLLLIPGNLYSILEFANSENTVIHARNVSRSCGELKSVQICLKLPKCGCRGNFH